MSTDCQAWNRHLFASSQKPNHKSYCITLRNFEKYSRTFWSKFFRFSRHLKFGVFLTRANFFPRTTIGIHRILKSYQIIDQWTAVIFDRNFDQSGAVIFDQICPLETCPWCYWSDISNFSKFRFSKKPFPFRPLTPVWTIMTGDTKCSRLPLVAFVKNKS